MSQQNVEIISGMYEAFAQGDVPGVLGQLDARVEWNEAENFIYADGSPYIGPEAVLAGIFVRLGAEWDAFTVTPASFHGAGETVLVCGRFSGTYRATGKAVAAQFAHVWTLAEGKVVKFQEYTDTLQFAQVVGQAQNAATA